MPVTTLKLVPCEKPKVIDKEPGKWGCNEEQDVREGAVWFIGNSDMIGFYQGLHDLYILDNANEGRQFWYHVERELPPRIESMTP